MHLFSSPTKLEERLVLSSTQKSIPIGGAFELLPLCNMNCRMCFLRLTPEEMQSQGRLRTVDEWLSLAKQAKSAGLLFLLLTGGEPFLYPDFDKLYKGLSELGLHITLNSNGTLITEEYADLLAKYRPRRINITLYGSSDEMYEKLCENPHGFTQVMRAIHLLKERNIAIKLNGSMTVDNWDDLENIQRIARELEIPLEIDTYMFPSSRKKVCQFDGMSRLTPEQSAEGFVKVKKEELPEEQFYELAKAMSRCYHMGVDFEGECTPESLPCRAGRSSFWVTWDGKMTPCVFLDQPAVPVFEQGFDQSWEVMKEKRKEIFMPSDCTRCGKRAFCTVCGACAYTETRDFAKRPDYMCRLTEEKLRLMSNLVKKSEQSFIEEK